MNWDWPDWDLRIVAVVYVVVFATIGTLTGWHWAMLLAAGVAAHDDESGDAAEARRHPGTGGALGIFALGVGFAVCSLVGALIAAGVRALR